MTDYEKELRKLERAISECRHHAVEPATEIHRATELIALQYQHASLTGSDVDFRETRGVIDQAIERFGLSDDLRSFDAQLAFTLHRVYDAERSLQASPTLAASSDGRRWRADIDFQLGRYGEAGTAYEKLIRENRSWEHLARLAYLEFKLGDRVHADALYAEAEEEVTVKEARTYAWLEVQRGLVAFAGGFNESALEHYQKAGAAYSGYWLVEEHLAEALGAQGRYEESAALYERAISRIPRPEMQQALGDLYAFMGKPELARPWHEKALVAYLESAQRGEVHHFHHLASLLADREDGTEAIQWARKDLELRQNFATYDALAWALYRAGDLREASDLMSLALASGVKDSHLFFHAAMISMAAGRTADSKLFLQKAAVVNPHYSAFHAHR